MRALGRFVWLVIATAIAFAYTVVTRTLLYLVTAYLVLYFWLNTDAARVAICDALTRLLPGSVLASSIEFAPSLTEVTITDANIEDGLGRSVIMVKIAEAGFDLGEFVRFGVALFAVEHPPLRIVLTKAHVIEPDVLVEVDPDGWTGIGTAFYDRSKPTDGGGLPPRVEIYDAWVTRGRVRVEVKGTHDVLVDSTGIEILGATVVSQGGHNWASGPHVTIAAGRIVVDGVVGEADSGAGSASNSALEIPWSNFTGDDPSWDDGVFRIRNGHIDLSSSRLAMDGTVDIRGHGSARLDYKASLIVDGEPILTRLFGLDLAGSAAIDVSGPARWPALRATLDAERLTMNGFSAGPIRTGFTVRTDPYRDAVVLDPTPIEIDGRPMFIDELAYERRGRPDEAGAVRARVTMPDVSTPMLLALGLPVPDMLMGTVEARFHVGRLARPVPLGTAPFAPRTWQADGALAFAGSMERVGSVPIFGPVGLIGRVEAHGGPAGAEVQSPGVYAWWGKDWTELAGSVHLPDGRLDIGGRARLGLLRWAGAVGIDDLQGTVRLDPLVVGGLLRDPTVTGAIRVKDCRYGTLHVKPLALDVTLIDGRLAMKSVSAGTPVGKLSGSGDLRLFAPGTTRLDPDMVLTVPKAELTGVALGKLPTSVVGRLGAELAPYGGTADFSVSALSVPLRARDAWARLTGRAQGRVLGVDAFDERFSSVDVAVHAEDRRLTVDRFEAVTTQGARLSAKGSYSFRRGTVEGTLSATNADFQTLASTRGKGLAGTLSADVALDGPMSNPRISGRVVASGVAVSEVPLGDAEVHFMRNEGDRKVVLDSSRFFPAFTLEKGTLTLDAGGVPSALALTIGLRELDLRKLLGKSLAGISGARVDRGTIVVGLDRMAKTPLRVALDIPGDGAVLDVDGRLIIHNRGALSARFDGSKVELERAVLAVGQYALAACGSFTPAGRVELDVAGSLDLADLPGLRKRFSALRGRVVTHSVAPPGLEGPFGTSCLLLPVQLDGLASLGDPSGFVHISDALAAPTFTGALRLEPITVKPRGFGREINIDSGVVVLRARDGLQAIEIPDDAAVSGSLEDGSFALTASATLPRVSVRRRLAHWLPDTGSITIQGIDLGYSAPKEYRFALDPRATLRFENLYQPTDTERARYGIAGTRPAGLELEGDVTITEGAYFRTFAAMSKAIGRVFEARSVGPVSRDLARSFPLIDTMKLDVTVRGTNFLVQSDFGVGKTDLDTRFDLRVGGTYASPTLFGNVSVVDGTITYNVFKREFEVTEGRLEFDGAPSRPVLDLRAETAIEVRTSSRLSETEDNQEYAITVSVGGRVPDYRIAFESKPSLPETDIQYLILLGRTKQQLAEEGASGGSLQIVSADLSALVTGLVQAPFVDELVVEPTLGGGGRVEAVLRLGRGIRIGLVGKQETTGARSYDARYRQRLLDRLILEASRRSASETTGERDRYEVQLDYTIPLD